MYYKAWLKKLLATYQQTASANSFYFSLTYFDIMRSFFSEPPSRSQRLGMYLACVVIFICLGFRFYLKHQVPKHPPPSIDFSMHWDSVLIEQEKRNPINDSIQLHPFAFNPNTVTGIELQRMGLRQKVVQTWLHYREKGGRFYNPEQVKRLYALRDTEYAQLAPYIRIENRDAVASPKRVIDINSADTTALMALPGIGIKRALAIIKYRDQLGGFYTTNQLLEIWAIDTPTYQRIKPLIKANQRLIKPLPLLEITWVELQKHPYFGGIVGRELLAWRKAKKYQIDSLNEIMEIKAIDSVLFRKIAPYLRLTITVQK